MSVSSARFALRTTFQLTVLLGAMVLTGCASITPVALSSADLKQQAEADRATARRDVPPITAALSLEEAIARALKYNLERRARMMEEALALNTFEAGKFDMLPKLVASAGYRSRNQDLVTRSIDSVTGAPSLANPAISSERNHSNADLGLTWSLLDFGLSYYGAQQNADRILIATERRRKAMHILIQDVRTAFWRTASAQKLRGDITATITLAESALVDSRQAESERLRSPIDALRFQRQLLDNLRQLEAIDQELSTARIDLAGLINAPLDSELTVIEPTDLMNQQMLSWSVTAMEDTALAQNADLREQNYNVRIASIETRKTLVRLFPNLSFNDSLRYDSDKYMINNHWNEAGLQLSFNLFNLFSAPAQMRLAEAGIALADQRRVTTQMAVLTQMHVARLQYASAVRQYQRADTIWSVDDRIKQHVANRASVQTQSKLDAVSNDTAAILSQLRRYQTLAQLNAAASRLQATLGMEPAIGDVQTTPLAQLTGEVGAALKQWSDGELAGTAKP
ncbi:TolC family protein [Actimicrobium sp. CCI2.3]|uniref:TolC family protein n=1 Tax=Actimicrobium sp. CCI2.3 TaxID=3048616 RepID=UPI002AB513C7|nr:TolC family protein [Actimicrobium sp. CCI2.3]MDY7575080.1 TolC family protein [Actimicrobium sp. CCI2.3]MEB0022579.1 TolC family protein [Actimicrobium sp. CCI2.3]